MKKEILLMRQSFLKFYKMYENPIVMISKFILMVCILNSINDVFGISTTINNIWVTLTLSIIAIFIQPSAILTISMFVVVYHVSSLSLILGATIAAVCIATYVLYIRLFPKESLIIIFAVLLLPVDAVYVVPLVSALFCGVSGIAAIAIGCLFSSLFAQLPLLMGFTNLAEISAETVEFVLVTLLRNTIFNTQMLTVITILSVVFLMVYIIRLQGIDYANYIAVCVGGVVSSLGFLIAELLLRTQVNIILMIFMTILSVFLANFISFLSIVLDYSRAETVQFEDEANYYYVKVVPKIELHEQTQTTQVFGNINNHF
ncbi:MAG: hypothetical protein BEN19_01120 [Epulopiscium sp. Nuni2H_MBin003]|nr:MAG: hypothetical protein BEN19_01120 [Epulopiscium sp. Nuni2H_MBin003]